MDVAKIHLSIQESELLLNTEWLLIKERIIQKIISFYGETHKIFKKFIVDNLDGLPSFISEKGGKISKGNNFKGLPFVVLDYPARFEQRNIFCVRCLFWWGNYVVISLHLSGKYFPQSNTRKLWLEYFKEKGFLINISEDEWCQEWDNCYEEIEVSKMQVAGNFLKFAAKIDLIHLENAPEFLEKKFIEILSFYKTNCHLNGETIL